MGWEFVARMILDKACQSLSSFKWLHTCVCVYVSTRERSPSLPWGDLTSPSFRVLHCVSLLMIPTFIIFSLDLFPQLQTCISRCLLTTPLECLTGTSNSICFNRIPHFLPNLSSSNLPVAQAVPGSSPTPLFLSHSTSNLSAVPLEIQNISRT